MLCVTELDLPIRVQSSLSHRRHDLRFALLRVLPFCQFTERVFATGLLCVNESFTLRVRRIWWVRRIERIISTRTWRRSLTIAPLWIQGADLRSALFLYSD